MSAFLKDVGYCLCGGWLRFISALAALMITTSTFATICEQTANGDWVCRADGLGGDVTVTLPANMFPPGEEPNKGCTNCVNMTPLKCETIKTRYERQKVDLLSALSALDVNSLINDITNNVPVGVSQEDLDALVSSFNGYNSFINFDLLQLKFNYTELSSLIVAQYYSLMDLVREIQALNFKDPDTECNISLSPEGTIDYRSIEGSSLYYKEINGLQCVNSLPQHSYIPQFNSFVGNNGVGQINSAYQFFINYQASKALYNFYQDQVKPLASTLTRIGNTIQIDSSLSAPNSSYHGYWINYYFNHLQGLMRSNTDRSTPHDMFEDQILSLSDKTLTIDFDNLLGTFTNVVAAVETLSYLADDMGANIQEFDCSTCEGADGGGTDVEGGQCSPSNICGCSDLINQVNASLSSILRDQDLIIKDLRNVTNDLHRVAFDIGDIVTNNLSVVTNTLTRLDDHIIDDYITAQSNLVSSLTEIRDHWSSPTQGGALNGGGSLGGSGIGQISLEEYSHYTPLERIEFNLLRMSDLLLPSEANTNDDEKSILENIETLKEQKLSVETAATTAFNSIQNTQELQSSSSDLKTSLTTLVTTFSSVFSNYNDPRSSSIVLTSELVDEASGLTFPKVEIDTTEIKPVFEYLRSATTILVELSFIFIYLAFGRWLLSWLLPLLSKIIDLYNSFTS